MMRKFENSDNEDIRDNQISLICSIQYNRKRKQINKATQNTNI